ncbi:MAG TPA: hypothetical protein VME01_04725 [Solirubrobacteraceae bacterium]|nr:hypothetical protein [Solirubrobacteraceae bacterium]
MRDSTNLQETVAAAMLSGTVMAASTSTDRLGQRCVIRLRSTRW